MGIKPSDTPPRPAISLSGQEWVRQMSDLIGSSRVEHPDGLQPSSDDSAGHLIGHFDSATMRLPDMARLCEADEDARLRALKSLWPDMPEEYLVIGGFQEPVGTSLFQEARSVRSYGKKLSDWARRLLSNLHAFRLQSDPVVTHLKSLISQIGQIDFTDHAADQQSRENLYDIEVRLGRLSDILVGREKMPETMSLVEELTWRSFEIMSGLMRCQSFLSDRDDGGYEFVGALISRVIRTFSGVLPNLTMNTHEAEQDEMAYRVLLAEADLLIRSVLFDEEGNGASLIRMQEKPIAQVVPLVRAERLRVLKGAAPVSRHASPPSTPSARGNPSLQDGRNLRPVDACGAPNLVGAAVAACSPSARLSFPVVSSPGAFSACVGMAGMQSLSFAPFPCTSILRHS